MVKKTSADEKKRMLLKVYHTRKEPFNNKEIVIAGKLAGLNDKLARGPRRANCLGASRGPNSSPPPVRRCRTSTRR